MLKAILLVSGILVQQFQYCLAYKMTIQKLHPGTLGRNAEDVAAVFTGAEFDHGHHCISLKGAKITTTRRDSETDTSPEEEQALKKGDLFRYTDEVPDAIEIETCPLKVVIAINKTKCFTYGAASFTLYDQDDKPMELVANLGTPYLQSDNQFGVNMIGYGEKSLVSGAMEFQGKFQQKFTAKFDRHLTDRRTIEGIFTGVTVRKNQNNIYYLLVEYKSTVVTAEMNQTNNKAEKRIHPLYPEEKEFPVDFSQYNGQGFADVAALFFAVIQGPCLKKTNSKVFTFTSVTMRSDQDTEEKVNLVIGYEL